MTDAIAGVVSHGPAGSALEAIAWNPASADHMTASTTSSTTWSTAGDVALPAGVYRMESTARFTYATGAAPTATDNSPGVPAGVIYPFALPTAAKIAIKIPSGGSGAVVNIIRAYKTGEIT